MRGQVVPFPHAARARPQGTAEQAAVSALDHGREGRCVLPGCLRPAGFKDFGRQGDPRDGVLRGGRSAVSPRGSQLRVPCRRLEPRPALPDQLAEPRGVARVQEVRRELRTQRGPDHQRQQDQLDRTRQRRAPGAAQRFEPRPEITPGPVDDHAARAAFAGRLALGRHGTTVRREETGGRAWDRQALPGRCRPSHRQDGRRHRLVPDQRPGRGGPVRRPSPRSRGARLITARLITPRRTYAGSTGRPAGCGPRAP